MINFQILVNQGTQTLFWKTTASHAQAYKESFPNKLEALKHMNKLQHKYLLFLIQQYLEDVSLLSGTSKQNLPLKQLRNDHLVKVFVTPHCPNMTFLFMRLQIHKRELISLLPKSAGRRHAAFLLRQVYHFSREFLKMHESITKNYSCMIQDLGIVHSYILTRQARVASF